jgi:dolichol-phosphate mannosyltransferase
MQNAYVISPVLNEVGNISNLVDGWAEIAVSFPGYRFQFLLVDDGSNDGTAEAAQATARQRDLALSVLRHESNRGPGAAFATGFLELYGRVEPRDVVITMEGDNTSRISTLKLMIERMDRENVDVALASPYAYGGGITSTTLYRIVLSHLANGSVKAFLGISGIHTISSFFRAYRGSVILSLQQRYGPPIIKQAGFECMVELLKKTMLVGATITEVPMKLDTSLRQGKSKMKVLRTITGYLRVFMGAQKWE